MYASQDEGTALRDSARLSTLHDVWQKHYAALHPAWAPIQHALNVAAQPITVKPVNQTAGTKSLDYKAHSETGLRVIAVGGNSPVSRPDP